MNEPDRWAGVVERLDELLEEGAAFVRGGDLTGAVARVHYAREELSCRVADLPPNGPLLEELNARVDHRIAEYEHLLSEWQQENAERKVTYLKRERTAIGADAGDTWDTRRPRGRWRPWRRSRPVSHA